MVTRAEELKEPRLRIICLAYPLGDVISVPSQGIALQLKAARRGQLGADEYHDGHVEAWKGGVGERQRDNIPITIAERLSGTDTVAVSMQCK
ncbi:hypothetical protein L249_3152 [Ophiocordyceps polyrhachis-furcata BCC 54312]|uniref:Uncharacterized protein n=1 Tax=Ophiocordyceps polyrhachis-furcata BCC 54312 TaxID=1330021 RepID=A0A367LSD4_9HYPO|nr:hypothetical protein L249_3152 [Ophiocordyceps polyrhachis-furcata BCC 54312]